MPETFTVQFESRGFQDIARNARGSRAIVMGAMNRALRDIGHILTPALKANTPRAAERGGRLANSTRFQVTGGPTDQRLEIRQGARRAGGPFYGPFVRLGTRPHEIRAVRAKALRFQIGGRTIYARRVQHPGTRPNRYDERTMSEQASNIQAAVDRAGIDVAAHLTRSVGSRD